MSKSNHVWIGRRVTRSVYHTDTECHHIPSDARSVDPETATEKMGLRECRYCAGESTNRGRNQYDVYPELHGTAED